MTQPIRIWSTHVRDMLTDPNEDLQRDHLYALHAICRVMENIQGTLEQIDARLARLEVKEGSQ